MYAVIRLESLNSYLSVSLNITLNSHNLFGGSIIRKINNIPIGVAIPYPLLSNKPIII